MIFKGNSAICKKMVLREIRAQAWRKWYIRVMTGHHSDDQYESRAGIYFTDGQAEV